MDEPAGGGRRARGLGLATALLAISALGPTAGAGQDVTLRCEVVDRDGQPAADVRLLIVGQPPEVVVRDNGMFAHPLTGSPSEVTVRVIGRPEVRVLFPPDGRVAVPRDPNAVVTVVVGEPIDAAVQDRIEADLRSIRETLALRGVADSVIEATVAAEMQAFVERIGEITRGAVEGAVAGAEQVELRERVNRVLSAYLRAAGDLSRVFALIEPDHELGTARFQLLYRTIEPYNQAYQSLDGELAATPAALARAWPGPAGVQLRQDLESILDHVETGFHRRILDLTGPLATIQQQYLSDRRPGRRELEEARRAVSESSPALSAMFSELEDRTTALMTALGAPVGG